MEKINFRLSPTWAKVLRNLAKETGKSINQLILDAITFKYGANGVSLSPFLDAIRSIIQQHKGTNYPLQITLNIWNTIQNVSDTRILYNEACESVGKDTVHRAFGRLVKTILGGTVIGRAVAPKNSGLGSYSLLQYV